MYIFLLPLAIVVLLSLPVISRIKHFTDGTKCRNAIIGNLCTFFGVMLLAVILPIGDFVSAEAVAETAGLIAPRHLVVAMGVNDPAYQKGTAKESEKIPAYYHAFGNDDCFKYVEFDGSHEVDKNDESLDFLLGALK